MLTALKRAHHVGRYRIVAEWVRPFGRGLLDVGCGRPSDGMADASFLRFIGYGTGLDTAPLDIPFPFVTGRLEHLPFPDRAFDAVTAIEVIEHLDDPAAGLREIHRVLRDGGACALTTPDNHIVFRVLWAAWSRTFGRRWRGAHRTAFTRAQWRDLIAGTGLFEIRAERRYWGISSMFLLAKRARPADPGRPPVPP